MRTLLLIVALLVLAGQPFERVVIADTSRVVVFFIDDLHLTFRDTGRIRNLVKRIAAELVRKGDRFAIVASGPSSLSVELTDDRGTLEEAIDKISGAGLKTEEVLAPQAPIETRSEIPYRAHLAFSAALDTLQKIGQADTGRKTLVYVSNGYAFDLALDGRSEFPASPLRAELGELTREAARANTTIYTIDALAMAGARGITRNVGSLRDIAEPTGGIAILSESDLEYALKRIAAGL
jgi:VWFA-related protein